METECVDINPRPRLGNTEIIYSLGYDLCIEDVVELDTLFVLSA